MAGFLSQNLRFLVGSLENTPGTLMGVTGSDYDTRIRDPQMTLNVELDDENSKWARGDHGEDNVITGVQTAQITFTIRCAWSGTAATEPDWAKFLKGCGQLAVAYTGVGVGYQPRKQYDDSTMSFYIYDVQTGASAGARITKIKGAMGNCVIGADGVGKPWLASFTFQGVVDSMVDVAAAAIIVPQGVDTSCSDKMLSNIAYVGTVAEKISAFSLDYGNVISPVYDQSSSAGVSYFHITERHPRITINPLAQLVATRDVWGQLTSGLTGCPSTMRVGIGDTGLDNKFWIQAPVAQLMSAAVANREGLVSWDQVYKLLPNGYTGSLTDAAFPAETCVELLQGKRA